MFQTIKARLTLAFLCLSIVPLLFLGIFLSYENYAIQKKNVLAVQSEKVKRISTEFELYITHLVNELDMLIRVKRITGMTAGDQYVLLSDLLAYENNFEEVSLLDRTGMELIRIHRFKIFLESDLGNKSQNDYFAIPSVKGEIYYSPIEFVEETGEPIMEISIPVAEHLSGTFYGILMVKARIKPIWNILAGIPEKSGEDIFILDSSDRVIAHPNPSVVLKNTVYSRKADSKGLAGGLRGDRVLMVEQPLFFGDEKYRTVAHMALNSAYALLFKTNLVIISLIVFVLGLALSMIILIMRIILLPIGDLSGAVGRIIKGDYSIKARIYRDDEIGELAEAFNHMTDSLAKTMGELKEEIAERKNMVIRTKALQNLLEVTINSMPSILIGVDRDGMVTQWNDMAVQTTGVSGENALGRSLFQVYPSVKKLEDRIGEALRDRKSFFEKKVQPGNTPERMILNIAVYPVATSEAEGSVIRIDDVTEQTRMEELLIQNEKMLSVGGLAAGMAHEINNPLAGLIQNANVLSNRLDRNLKMHLNEEAALKLGLSLDQVHEFMEMRDIPHILDSMKESGMRISAIVNNMLSFARSGDSAASSHIVSEILDQTIELASTDYDLKKAYDFRKIRIEREYGDGNCRVLCEKSKLQQVFLNILRNGAQAMDESKTKEPRFHLKTSVNDPGRTLDIEIGDNGPGMEDSVRKRVFEPFFTTKPEGVGTGLGLSVSYFIITENHNGTMTVESQPGEGTTFRISLPLPA